MKSSTPEHVDAFENLISAGDAARLMDCSDKTVRNLLRRGELKGFQVGNRWKTRPSWIEEWAVNSAHRLCPPLMEEK